NGLRNIVVNQSAVGNSQGEVSFTQSFDSAFSSIHDTQRRPFARTLIVPMTTLDEYVEQHEMKRVDVLRIDVEGTERLVVSGETRLLTDESRRPKLIMMELQDQNLQAFGITVNTVLDQMTTFGYEPFVVGEGGEVWTFNDKLMTRYCNVLFSVAQ